MFVRSSYEYYTDRVEKYFKALLAKVSHLQFYRENGAKGGPIIMAQVSKIDFAIECWQQETIKNSSAWRLFSFTITMWLLLGLFIKDP